VRAALGRQDHAELLEAQRELEEEAIHGAAEASRRRGAFVGEEKVNDPDKRNR
jgi:hypothetical protein